MKFSQKILRIGDFKKLIFIELATLIFFFSKKKHFLLHPMKISDKLCVRMDGTQFYYYDGLQPKISAGLIELHECRSFKGQNYSLTKRPLPP